MRRLTRLVALAVTLLGAGCDDLIGPLEIELPRTCGAMYDQGAECDFHSPQAPAPPTDPGVAEHHPFVAQAWNQYTESGTRAR